MRGRQEPPRCSGGRQAAAPGLCPLLAVPLAVGGCPLGVAARVSAGWDPRLALQRGFPCFFLLFFFFPSGKSLIVPTRGSAAVGSSRAAWPKNSRDQVFLPEPPRAALYGPELSRAQLSLCLSTNRCVIGKILMRNNSCLKPEVLSSVVFFWFVPKSHQNMAAQHAV